MAYADGDSLKVRIRIAFGANPDGDPFSWAWTDVTPYWHVPDDVQIQWGRSPGAAGLESSTLRLTLKNTDSRFSPDHGQSPYWPHVRQWTPISFEIDLGDGAGWRQRFGGYVRKWGVSWPGSALAAYAQIEAVGEAARISRGEPPAWSPIRRSITAAVRNPKLLAYWPLEDASTSTQGASGLPSGPPMVPTGTVGWAGYDPAADTDYGPERRASSPLPVLMQAGGMLSGVVPAGSSSPTAWTVHLYRKAPLISDVALVHFEWRTTGGTHTHWRYGQRLGGALGAAVQVRNSSGTWTTAWSSNQMYGGPNDMAISARQNGSSIQFWVKYSSSTEGPITLAGTLGRVAEVTLNPDRVSTGASFHAGHVRVWDQHDIVVEGNRSWSGFRGDGTIGRLERLRAENGTWLHIDPAPLPHPAGEAMGPQPYASTLALYEDIERTDGGLLYERGHSLGYLPRVGRYAPPVALTLDGAAGQVGADLSMSADDQQFRTRVQATRPYGSSVTVEDPGLVDRHGAHTLQIEPNLYHDTQLEPVARWHLHLATVREPRMSAMSVRLHAHPELAAQWVQCREGSRVQVVNPPPQSGMTMIDQIISGATEVFGGRRRWTVTMSTTPAAPLLVAIGGAGQRVGAVGTTTDEPLPVDGMAVWIVNLPSNGGWTTNSARYPLDVMIGGEHARASGIVGTGLGQQLLLSARGLNGVRRAWPTGTPVDVWRPGVVAL